MWSEVVGVYDELQEGEVGLVVLTSTCPFPLFFLCSPPPSIFPYLSYSSSRWAGHWLYSFALGCGGGMKRRTRHFDEMIVFRFTWL
jgi:hypothetical protein